MAQHNSGTSLAAIYYTLGTSGPCHNIAQAPILLLFTTPWVHRTTSQHLQHLILLLFITLWAHWTTSQHSSRTSLAAIGHTLDTLEH
eukprot:3878056-Karenia_brevis.AAC.1